jgi:hypothetical protein
MSSTPSRLERWQCKINEVTGSINCLDHLVRSCVRLTRSLALLVCTVGSLVGVLLLALHHLSS